MPREVWGTFSVVDHLRVRPYIADVLLYDRLVIPVVPKDDDAVRDSWNERGWYPNELDEIVKAISEKNADLVWAVPWDLQNNEAFKARFEAAMSLASDVHDLAMTREADPNRPAFQVTRRILEGYAKDPANSPDLPADVWVDAMAAYPSYQVFCHEFPVDLRARPPSPAETTLAGVFGWEFVVPDEPKMSDLKLLGAAAELASDPTFRKKRRAFHDWRRKVIKEGITEKAAFEEMQTLVNEYNDITRKSGLRTTTLNGFTVAGITAGVAASVTAIAVAAGAVAVPAAYLPILSLGGAFFTTCRFGTEQLIPASAPSPDQQAAAMFHDARKWFGWS